MPAVIVLGAQWGDEGKGKATDQLGQNTDYVVKFNGGNNAGHTVVIDGEKYAMHLLPAGILSKGVTPIIGNGVVVDIDVLFQELAEMESRGVDCSRLKISSNAHIIPSYNRLMDQANERARGKNQIGTTGRGIGPTYADKMNRVGIRIQDLFDPKTLSEKIEAALAPKNEVFAAVGMETLDPDTVTEELLAYADRIRPMVCDASLEVNEALDRGDTVLFEGGQATMLDIDHGTYPYVSSSSTTSGGVCTGLGIAPNSIGHVFGIFKAYSTRVGGGPFPVELFDETGDTIRHIGNEYGAVTGRNRRCGWLDLVALKYAIMINGVTDLVMMKGDVLDGFDTIKVCTAYTKDGETVTEIPYDTEGWQPVYEELPGWKTDLTAVRAEKDFPAAFASYIAYIEKATGTPIKIVSVGPDREATIIR